MWDIDFIAETFKPQIAKIDNLALKTLFTGTQRRAAPQQLLLSELKSCGRGKPHWMVYQELVARLIEHLFCPALKRPLTQSSDLTATNRRDFVLPNYAADGFWYYLRTRYSADYIVADAENYTGGVKKRDVLQIANYLRPHGAGLFGIIFSRLGADNGARITIREQWLEHHKLILVLTDEDVEEMLLAQAAGGDPTSVISDRIQDFRLSF